MTELQPLRVLIAQLQAQVTRLTTVNNILMTLSTTFVLDSLLNDLVKALTQALPCERAIVLITDEQEAGLVFGASQPSLPNAQNVTRDFHISTASQRNHAVIGAWLRGQTASIENAVEDVALQPLVMFAGLKSCLSVPLMLNEHLVGVILVDNSNSGTPLNKAQCELVETIAASVVQAVENARLQSKIVKELADNMNEMNILRQIDRELNDTIKLDNVFDIALDWALRFTNARVASLALYDEDTDELRVMAQYGYEVPREQLEQLRLEHNGGISHRVARAGRPEVIPDVSMDPDYIPVASGIQAQMSVPVLREDRVVAVVTVESKKLNAFTDGHLDFVLKLATRAGVAIDNARLFTETVREREKLSRILNNIADVVIVVGTDDRIMLINQSAISALRLYTPANQVGQPFSDVLDQTALLDIYRRARAVGEGLIEEVTVPSGRTFHTKVTPQEGVGWIVVMHDITPFKEMDQLKSQLIATVSHDLKQPLSVMSGYIELLTMMSKLEARERHYVDMVQRSIHNMRQLIDDLLDLAKIESGIELELRPVHIEGVLAECLDAMRPFADSKAMHISSELPSNMPLVTGDEARLRQVFTNLISNAVKYTPPEGNIRVWAEQRGGSLRVAIQDSGLGISPEDQAHIFDRFYRVRRPETDSIDGTGLGLAIVKSLVDAHKGEIDLESRLGEGSTFYLTLPIAETSNGPS